MKSRGRSLHSKIRPLSAFQNLKHEIGRAAESGGTVHIAMGNGGLVGDEAVASFAALEAVAEMADTAVLYNAPPVITVGDPTLLPLAQDILREAYERHGLTKRYNTNQVRFVAPSPVAYAAGAANLTTTGEVTTTLTMGAFGPEVSLIADASARRDLNQLAAAAAPNAIAALYPATDQLAMGEEMYAAGAQLTNKIRYMISLQVQDWFLRPLLAIIIGIIALLGLAGLWGS
jgi:hypothetical protein